MWLKHGQIFKLESGQVNEGFAMKLHNRGMGSIIKKVQCSFVSSLTAVYPRWKLLVWMTLKWRIHCKNSECCVILTMG